MDNSFLPVRPLRLSTGSSDVVVDHRVHPPAGFRARDGGVDLQRLAAGDDSVLMPARAPV